MEEVKVYVGKFAHTLTCKTEDVASIKKLGGILNEKINSLSLKLGRVEDDRILFLINGMNLVKEIEELKSASTHQEYGIVKSQDDIFDKQFNKQNQLSEENFDNKLSENLEYIAEILEKLAEKI